MMKDIKNVFSQCYYGFPTMKIRSAIRLDLERNLWPLFKKLRPGVVLDIGSDVSWYKRHIPHTQYLRLDIDASSNPDICCDLYETKLQSNHFDTIIAIEVLEHLCDPRKAVQEMHRILKPGGTCILSTRFIFKYHPNPKDYYRFTPDSLNDIFSDFKGVDIFPHGNRLLVFWHVINEGAIRIVLNIFNPLIARLSGARRTRFPSGFIVYAKK